MKPGTALLAMTISATAVCLSASVPALSAADALGSKSDLFLTRKLASRPQSGWSEVIVKTTGGDLTASQEARIKGLGGYVYRHLGLIDAAAVRIPNRNARRLAALPFVKRLSTDAAVQKTDEFIVERSGADRVVSGLGLTGAGVTVAVIDSGVAHHRDLADGGKASRIVDSVDFVGDGLGDDPLGHGTHVAGIIAGDGYSSRGSKYYRTFNGIAPGTNLVSVRVLDRQGSGRVSDVIAGIDWVLRLDLNRKKPKQGSRQGQVQVINLSLGHPVFESYTTDPLCQAVESAWKSGVVVVCSAGNVGRRREVRRADRDNEGFGTAYGSIQSPGNSPFAITVGAMKADPQNPAERSRDRITTYSSRGPSRLDMVIKPDLVAPGEQVISLEANNDTTLSLEHGGTNQIKQSEYVVKALAQDKDKTSNRYFRLSGTSMAAPVVSGAVALMLQKDPGLNPDTVKVRLMLSADKWRHEDGTADILTFGAGYLNIPAALATTTIVPTTSYAISPILTVGADGNLYVDMDRAIWGPAGLWESGIPDFGELWGDGTIEIGSPNIVTDMRALWGKSKAVQEDKEIRGRALSATADVTVRAVQGDQQ